MFKFQMASRLALLLITVSLASGCSSDPAASSSTAGTPQAHDGLGDLARLLKSVKAQGGTPPRTPADFAKHDVACPAAGTLIQNGTITYLPGDVIDEAIAPPQLIALQADAETTGGWVLLSTGEVQDLPAAEIAALPRPSR
jgi:hypothetical protein